MNTSNSILTELLRRGRETPNQPWLFQPNDGVWSQLSWGEGVRQISCMASALQARGYPAGSRICITGRNTAHWVMADLAIMLAGYVPVGIYPKQSLESNRYVMEHSGAKALFLGPSADIALTLKAAPEGIETIAFPYDEVPEAQFNWDELVAGHAPLEAYQPPAPESLAVLIYTSGTSGQPKAVMISHANIAFTISHLLTHVLPPKAGDRVLSYLPLAHTFERLCGVWFSAYAGVQMHFLERIEAMGATLASVAPTVFVGVPLVYTRLQAGVLARIPDRKLQRWLRVPLLGRLLAAMLRRRLGLHRSRMCVIGGAPVSAALVTWFGRLGIQVREGYGPSEVSAYATCNVPGAERVGSAGRVLPDCELRLSDEGEVQVRHGGVTAGYFRDEALTRETFTEDGYLRTGDLATLDADGFLRISGRIKEIFKTEKGKYVAPAPIENAMNGPLIDQMCLTGAGLKQPVLMLCLTQEARRLPRAAVEAALLQQCELVNAKLEPHERIGRLIVTAAAWLPDNGCMTPTMKVRRNAIDRVYADLLADVFERDAVVVWEAKSG